MKKIYLKEVNHTYKVGDICGPSEPNVKDDSLFMTEQGEVVGFYIKNIFEHDITAAKLADIANQELLSERVPKSTMKRSSGFSSSEKEVLQYSTIIGSVPPKPHMRRSYPTMSSVHNVSTAQIFVKSMLRLCFHAEELIRCITPN